MNRERWSTCKSFFGNGGHAVVSMDSDQHTKRGHYNGDGQLRGPTVQGLGNYKHISNHLDLSRCPLLHKSLQHPS